MIDLNDQHLWKELLSQFMIDSKDIIYLVCIMYINIFEFNSF